MLFPLFAWIPYITLLCFIVFLASVGASGFCIISLVYIIEVSNWKYRVYALSLFYIARSLSFIFVSGITLIFPNILEALLFMSGLPSFLLLWNLESLCESPRYLILKHDFNVACLVLEEIATLNNLMMDHIKLKE